MRSRRLRYCLSVSLLPCSRHLMLLKALGPHLGTFQVRCEMFWATGALSSFLDNTPTYLVFLTTAGTLGFTERNRNDAWHCAGETACLQFPVVRYSWARTLISEMHRTLWSSPFLTRTVSTCRPSSDTSCWSLVFLVPVFILDMLVFFM